MTRALITLHGRADMERAIRWISQLPARSRIEFRPPARTNDQNAKLWATLSDIARQKEHGGRKYTADAWKAIFMQAWGRETEFAPTLDGSSFFPMGYRSSELSKQEMCELLEFILAWCAENGIELHDDEACAA